MICQIIVKLNFVSINKIVRLILVKEQIMLRHVKEKRAEQHRSIKEWEAEINTLDRSSAGNAQNAKITVENNYDLEGPPRHMTYMNSV